MYNVPLARQGRMHPWEFQILVSSIFTIARQYAGQGTASSDANQPRPALPGAVVTGATTWPLSNGCLGSRHGLVIGNTLAIACVRRRQWESGCHESHGGTIRRRLVSDGLVLHV